MNKMTAEFAIKRLMYICAVVFFIPWFQACESNPSAKKGEDTGSSVSVADEDRLLRQAAVGSIFEPGFDEVKTPTIGILKPEGSYLSQQEMWLPDMIQSAMNNNFTKFARTRIIVVNLTNEQARIEELIRSQSGSRDGLDVSARRAARAIMTGKVIKTGATRFTLEFLVQDTETGDQLASYSQSHSDIELDQGIAVNKATEDLLSQLNVKLNEAGRYALYGASNDSSEAATALAKGLSAAQAGQGLKAMNYLYNATAYDTTASMANTTLRTIQSRNMEETRGAGKDVLDFFDTQEMWQTRLNEYNDFYWYHAPFELFYTIPTAADMSGTASAGNQTYSLNFKIGLRWNQNQITTMEKVLQEYILDGLNKDLQNPHYASMTLEGRPEDSELFQGPDNIEYNLVINVENERGEVITSDRLHLAGSLYRYNDRIYASCVQTVNASFPNIRYDRNLITPQLYIRIVSINGNDMKTVGENGFTRVTMINERTGERFPAEQPDNIPKEIKTKKWQAQTAAKNKARQAQAAANSRERKAQMGTRTEMYAGVTGGLALGADPIAGNVDINVGLGMGRFDAEVGLLLPLGYKDLLTGTNGEERSILGINIGVNFTWLWLKDLHLLANIGPAITFLTILDDDGASNASWHYTIYGIQTRLDWGILDPFYLRVGYRLDIYPYVLTPLFPARTFKPDSIFLVHNIFIGLVYYLH
jgi:hypothetical protein